MIIPQLITNGIITGAIYALMAASFSLIFNIVKFMDISPGALFVVGPFVAYLFNVIFGLNIILSTLIALIISALVGLLINFLVYKPCRKRNADAFTLLLASVGVFLTITGLILLFFGADIKTFGLPIENGCTFLGAIITSTQIIIIIFSLIFFVLLLLLTKHTKTGKAMRAVADDKDVASTLGINIERTISVTFAISAVLAALSGILVSFEQNLEHSMGFGAVLKGITASIIGGVGNVPAALVGGFLIGIVENIGIWFLPSGYNDSIAFILLIIFLLFRPQGIFGINTREEMSG